MPLTKVSKSDGRREIQVRATVSVAFAAAVITGFFIGMVSEEAFLSMATMAISWYFARRYNTNDYENQNSDPTITTTTTTLK